MSAVVCVECGKPLEKIPAWLAGVQVKFTCEECRTKHRTPLVIVDDLSPLTDEPAEDLDIIEREEGLETTSLEELAQEEEKGLEEEEEEV
ncbi:MAG: hypothetical protein RMM08_06315 [Armatimonadota bacterium]|nr:hypothetical protein [bacterium]MDW8320958.1 hypothetical protein [Armatimonadota bacterium]